MTEMPEHFIRNKVGQPMVFRITNESEAKSWEIRGDRHDAEDFVTRLKKHVWVREIHRSPSEEPA